MRNFDRSLVELAPAIRAATQRIRANSGEWEDYLLLLGLLPKILLQRYCVQLTTPDEFEAYEVLMFNYVGVAKWLHYLVPGTKQPDPDLFFTELVNLKPRAEYSKAILDLATQLLPKCEALQVRHTTPAALWFAVEVAYCDEIIYKSGLVDGVGLKPASKDDMATANRLLVEILQNTSRLKLRGNSDMPRKGSALEGFFSWTAAIARDDESFRNSSAYQIFQKKTLALTNAIRKGKDYRVTVFQNGTRISSRKGFVTKSKQKK